MANNKKPAVFPSARIKRIMQSDEDVGKIATLTPVLVGKALELLIVELISGAAREARRRGVHTVSSSHFKALVHSESTFDFLRDVFKDTPDAPAPPPPGAQPPPASPGAAAAAGAKKRGRPPAAGKREGSLPRNKDRKTSTSPPTHLANSSNPFPPPHRGMDFPVHAPTVGGGAMPPPTLAAAPAAASPCLMHPVGSQAFPTQAPFAAPAAPGMGFGGGFGGGFGAGVKKESDEEDYDEEEDEEEGGMKPPPVVPVMMRHAPVVEAGLSLMPPAGIVMNDVSNITVAEEGGKKSKVQGSQASRVSVNNLLS